jgi:hypothetical protein
MGSDLYLSLNQEAKIRMGKVIGKIAHPRNVTGAWVDAHGRLIEGHFLLMKTPEVSEFVIEGWRNSVIVAQVAHRKRLHRMLS